MEKTQARIEESFNKEALVSWVNEKNTIHQPISQELKYFLLSKSY